MPRAHLLLAAISVACVSMSPAQAEPAAFDFGAVRLLESPFLDASNRNLTYILGLEADRLLHNTRKYAGLEPRGELYGGWESAGIAGHTLGHYLTALSQQYAATGDVRFRDRVDYIVGEMALAQQAYGDGYIGALPQVELDTLRKLRDGIVAPRDPFFFDSGAWVPWYTQHKILAGLRDAWTLADNKQARTVLIELGDWVDGVTSGLSHDQLQSMLEVEHGGMSEVMIDLYALTDEPRYLAVSKRFHHHAVLEPLRSGRDELPGKHANTQIPKITGAARSYEVTGQKEDRQVAQEFWHRVVDEHSWVIGGNSDGEHFFVPDEAAQHLSPATAESCNTYNMLKLTEHLFRWQPDVEYADYYERALYNHILASQEPERGMFAYFMSLKPGFFKTFSTPHDSFWCCVGSGMENHTKYGKAIYFHDDDRLYVNLYIPSVLDWQQQGLVLEQHTRYPDSDRSELVIKNAPDKPLELLVRAPAWAGGDIEVALNGLALSVDGTPGQYISIEREWKAGDRLSIRIPMSLRSEALRGSKDQVAILYGPIVLAGDLGPVERTGSFPYAVDQWDNFESAAVPVPLIRGGSEEVLDSIRRTATDSLQFTTTGKLDGDDVSIDLRPYSSLHYRHYNVYWKVADDK